LVQIGVIGATPCELLAQISTVTVQCPVAIIRESAHRIVQPERRQVKATAPRMDPGTAQPAARAINWRVRTPIRAMEPGLWRQVCGQKPKGSSPPPASGVAVLPIPGGVEMGEAEQKRWDQHPHSGFGKARAEFVVWQVAAKRTALRRRFGFKMRSSASGKQASAQVAKARFAPTGLAP